MVKQLSTLFLLMPLICAVPLNAQTWTNRQPMPVGVYEHAAATGKDAAGVDRVYVFGGTKLNSIGATVASNAVYGYNPLNNTWNQFAPMPTARSQATATSLGKKIYVIGGLNAGYSNGLNTVEAYEPAFNTWSTLAPLPVPVTWAGSAAYGGKLYVFGGYQPNSGIALKSTYEYNPDTNTWIQRQDMPGPTYAVGAGALCNGAIYVIGNGVNYQYTVATNSWTIKTPVPPSSKPHYGRGMAVGSDQRIYLINDRNYFLGDPVVYAYLFTNDTWTETPNTVVGLTTNASAHLNGYLYTTGGILKTAGMSPRLEKSSLLDSCSCTTFKGKPSLICKATINAGPKGN